MLIDTHAHVNFSAFKDDSGETIRRALDDNIWMINVGSQYGTSLRAVKIAENYETGVYAAIGLHPIHLSEGIFKTKIDKEEIEFKTYEESFDYEKYGELAKSEKVVAVGEVGLDYYYKPKTKVKFEKFKSRQEEVLKIQLDFAQKLDLPVIFHCRMAHSELIKFLKARFRNQNPRLRGVVHCFTGTLQNAREYMDMGFYLGFNGIIFKLNLDEVIKKIPLDRILIETDCPYLSPPQISGRNEPRYVKYVAGRIAEIKEADLSEIEEKIFRNAGELFKI